MPIFTDKRELEIQKKKKRFTGDTNFLGKIGEGMKYVPGLDMIGNELVVAGSTGDYREQAKTEGRKEALANTINTASTVASMVVPGGPLASMALNQVGGGLSGVIRGKEDKVMDAVETTEDFEKSGSAIVNETLKENNKNMAMEGLEEAASEVDVDELTGMASETDYVTGDAGGSGLIADASKGGGMGNIAKGVGQAANVASVATSAAGLVSQQFASKNRLEDARKKKRTETLNNEYFTYA